MVEDLLRQRMAPVDSVHNLQGPVRGQFMTSGVHPVHETRRLFGQPYTEQSIERESGVSNPGVSVIPVADASKRFRQTAGWRGDNRACRLIGEQLQRQSGAMYRLAPSTGVRAF